MPHNTTANFNGFRVLVTSLHGTILHHGDELTVQFLFTTEAPEADGNIYATIIGSK